MPAQPGGGRGPLYGRTHRATALEVARIAHRDFTDFSPLEGSFPVTTRFFCLGVSSIGMNESDYRRVTYVHPAAAQPSPG